jgi:hypothetical protein
MRRALLLVLLALVAGCGQPTDPKKQAEDLGSVAAEGALLAHDAADDSSLGPFTRVHSEVLRKDVEKLEPKLKKPELEQLAEQITSALDSLPDHPDAAGRRLGDAAERAEKLAK